MSADPPPLPAEALRNEVRSTYREVALNPRGTFDFHTGRYLATRLGYPEQLLNAVPAAAVEAFCGVANPFALRPLTESERIVDVGSGAGLDTFAAACQVGPTGLIIGVDMTSEMVARARTAATAPGW